MRLFYHAAILLALAAPLSARHARSHARASTPDPAITVAPGEGRAAGASAGKEVDLAVADTGAEAAMIARSRVADTESKGAASTATMADGKGARQADSERK